MIILCCHVSTIDLDLILKCCYYRYCCLLIIAHVIISIVDIGAFSGDLFCRKAAQAGLTPLRIMGKDQDLLQAVRNQDKEMLQKMLNKNKASPKGSK